MTNYIAVRMLFRPRRERRILGVPLHGLVPRRRSEIARKIAETVERHLISHDDIRRALAEPRVNRRIRDFLDQRVARLLDEKLVGFSPMVNVFFTERLRSKVRDTIMEEILRTIPPMTEQIMDALEENLDFRQLVVKKIDEFDLEALEQIVLQIAARELRAIEILGGVLGFFIGLIADLLLLL